MNPGSFSRSTLSVTWNLLLLCFLGVLPAMGIVSLPAPRILPSGPLGGGIPPPAPSSPPPTLLGTSPPVSPDDDTTTMGGAGEVLSVDDEADVFRSGVDGACWPAREEPPETREESDAVAGDGTADEDAPELPVGAEADPFEGRGGTGLLPFAAGTAEGTMGGVGEGALGFAPLESLELDLVLESCSKRHREGLVSHFLEGRLHRRVTESRRDTKRSQGGDDGRARGTLDTVTSPTVDPTTAPPAPFGTTFDTSSKVGTLGDPACGPTPLSASGKPNPVDRLTRLIDLLPGHQRSRFLLVFV